MASRIDLLELARHLRQEHLFVASERQQIQNLNDKVLKAVENLFHVSWIAKHQRVNLDSLIYSKPTANPTVCCYRANTLEQVIFIDSYKQLNVHDAVYAEFLQLLREDPKLIGMCLVAGEKINLESMQVNVPVIMSAIYGNCVLPEDEVLVQKLLKELIVVQLAISDDPRRLLRHGSCAFSQVYKPFSEGLFSAKLFLTATLHEAIMHLLMEDDLFLDIDPGKAVVRFPPQERLRHFGREGTPDYAANLQKYRNRTIGRLVKLTNRFIEGIRSNIYCFPQSISWLVRQLYDCVLKGGKVEMREVGAMCADLVFAFFICPAIVNPEPYGITEAPISDIARFNLMQVAQILQVLAMSKWEEIDPKLMDLYGKFEKDCMSSILDLILEGSTDESPACVATQMNELSRFAVLITESELVGLVSFLSSIQHECQDETLQKTVSGLIANLPANAVAMVRPEPRCAGTPITPENSHSNLVALSETTPISTPSSTKKNLLGKVSRKSLKATLSSLPLPESLQQHDESQDQSESILNNIVDEQPLEDVLVIPLNHAIFDCPGMLSVEKVLSLEQQQKQSRVRLNLDSLAQEEVESNASGAETVEKRTRFSLSQDQESIGASDNLEAISEAASNHSVASSLDMENENENDNLSDMVSANVSGRGTPNVSGRDTPSSQLEGEEQPQRQLDLPVITRKQNRADIEDKFGKFEIQPMMEGDETKSMVSDTWSTDVLASDSETVEQSDIALQIIMESQVRNFPPPGLLDISETASQSDAWSTDVVTSDTERMQELDMDDAGSVARSDEVETASSCGVETARSEQGDILDDLELMNVSSPIILERPPYYSNSNQNIRGRRGSHGLEGSAFREVSSLRRGLQSLDGGSSGGGSAFREVNVRRSSQGILRDIDSNLALRDLPPKHSDLVGSSVAAASTTKELLLQQSLQTNTSKSDVIPNPKQYFNPLTVDVDHSTPELNSSPSIMDDLTPTGGSPPASNNSTSESSILSPSRMNGNQETVLSMQSLGRLSLAVRELSDSGDQDCAAFLLDTLQESNTDPSVTNGVEPREGQRSRSSIADLLALHVAKKLILNEPGSNERPPNNSLLDFEQDLLGSEPKQSDTFYNAFEGNGDSKKSPKNDVKQPALYAVSKEGFRTRLSSASMSSSSSSCSGSAEAYRGDVGQELVGDAASNALADAQNGDEERFVIKDRIIQSGAMTGAIPKSISFDKTADKAFRELEDDRNGNDKNRKSFFKLTNFRFTFKGRNRKPRHLVGNRDGYPVELTNKDRHTLRHLQRTYSEEVGGPTHPETTDEILAKYRKKTPGSTPNEPSDPVNLNETSVLGSDSVLEEDSQVFEVGGSESSFVFNDAKRKLRMVLGSADIQTLPWLTGGPQGRLNGPRLRDNDLVAFLKVLLAEAINLQQRPLVAHLHEALRCVRMFDDSGCQKLLKSLKVDYKRRAPYISYLVRCRQGLLSTLAHLEALQGRIHRDKDVCSKYLITLCVRTFLENREKNIDMFLRKFQALTVADEMAQLVEKFLAFLYSAMDTDPLWRTASPIQLEDAHTVIERTIMSQIYIRALYPNGDGDALRDQVFYQHMQKLSMVITVDHKDLRIPKIYHHECPWPSAQAEIITINAYKTPRDKIQCVLRCASTIMNLLVMAGNKSVPAADDFMPVLVYVLIKANPPSLLSAKEYINTFYEKQLEGEDSYWWTQFSAAVEFIKTMDY